MTNLEPVCLNQKSTLFPHKFCEGPSPIQNHKGGLRNRILPLQLSVQSIRQQHKYLNLSFPAAVHRLLSYALWELSYRWASDNRRKSGFQPYNKWLHYHIRLPNHRADSQKTVYTLGNHHKMQVTATTNHLPCFGPPFVSIFHKEIGSKAGVDKCSRWYLEFSVTLLRKGRSKFFVRTTTELSTSRRASPR